VSSPTAYAFDRQRIVVADDDCVTSAMITNTLKRDGHCVSLDPGAFSTAGVLAECHLLISSLRVAGVVRMDLLEELRECRPTLPILFLAREGPLPGGLPSLCVPFTTEELQAAVRRLLPGLHTGTVLAVEIKTPAGESTGSVPLDVGADSRGVIHG
jgi:DNA-binding response OmpR family regulator